MLNRLFKRLVAKTPDTSAKIYAEHEHSINQRDISPNALRVIEHLQHAGYAAYLVGGGVRDLLLGGHPKDFDVATDATPEEVKKVFNRARIIGRRFRIVHVHFGREMIEVTTFRGHHSQASTKGEAAQSDKGILLRDNVYGDILSDALRRDFTINALYYDPTKRELLDFTDGMSDLRQRQLRLIGDPDKRYKEDPVRMLRAVRFSAKLGFTIEAATEAPIREHADYLGEIPSARLFEEVLKLFLAGAATATLSLLRDYGLLAYLFPGADKRLKKQQETFDSKLIFAAASNTDKRIRQNKSVTPAFFYAAMLWPPLRAEIADLCNNHGLSHYDAMQRAAQGVVNQQLAHTAIPKRFLIPMREMWMLQLRLARREGQRAQQTLEHPRFRAAYDFLLLREEAGENLNGLGLWWTQFQSAGQDKREEMSAALAAGRPPAGTPRRRSRRRRPPAASPPAE